MKEGRSMRPEHWLFTIRLRLRSLFRWAQADQELDDELRDHLERKTEEYVAKGMAPEEARRRARLDLGGIEQAKEKCRDARRVNWIQDFVQDLHYGLRILRKSPGFTAVAILTLALGIGANTAIFSVVDAVLLRSLPYKNPSRLTIIWQTDAAHRASGAWFDTYREFEEWAQHSKSFERLAALTWARVPPTVRLHGKLERVLGIPVTSGFFSTLGVEAAHGRTFALEDSQTACTVVLSDAFWHGELGGADIVGRTLTVNDESCLVAGIMPKDFSFYPKRTQLWMLITPQGEYAKNPWSSMVGVVGLLATASIRYLNAMNPVELPPGNPITINWQILAFTALLAISSTLLFGLAPAWKASRFDLNAVLKKEGGRTHFAAKYLVISEVALSLVLLAGAALMIESLHRLISTPLGFQPAHLLTANIDLTSKTYSTSDERLNFYNKLKSAVLAIPGVQGVALAPLFFAGSNALSVEGKRGEYQDALGNDVSEAAVDVDYFRVMEIPLLKGREFDATDQQKTLPVAIVNEALASK